MSRWCAPAAATASASRPVVEAAHVGEVERFVALGRGRDLGRGIGRVGPRRISPLRHWCSSPSDAGDADRRAAARAPLPPRSASGTITCSTPARIERVDERDRARPPAAPRRRARARRARRHDRASPAGRPPAAHVNASATPSSSPAPVLRTEAGARFTVTRCCGYSRPDDNSAARTRSRDSRPAASGSPTTVYPGSPRDTWTSMVTIRPSTPSSTALRTAASTIDPHFATDCGRRVVTATSTGANPTRGSTGTRPYARGVTVPNYGSGLMSPPRRKPPDPQPPNRRRPSRPRRPRRSSPRPTPRSPVPTMRPASSRPSAP